MVLARRCCLKGRKVVNSGLMRTDFFHLAGRFFALLTLICFFLPWVRVSPDALRKNTMEVVKNLAQGDKGVGRTLIWMRGEEWQEIWADPADGFSGFQLVIGAASGTPRIKAQQELASVVLGGKEKRPLLGWLLLVPILAGLGWGFFILGGVPPSLWALVSLMLMGIYFMLRWKMADAYTDRLLAQLQLGPGWWGALYGMLGLAVVCLCVALRKQGGNYSSKIKMF